VKTNTLSTLSPAWTVVEIQLESNERVWKMIGLKEVSDVVLVVDWKLRIVANIDHVT
jgi:hypothetical protein